MEFVVRAGERFWIITLDF